MQLTFPQLIAIATRSILASLLSDLSSTQIYGDALVWIKLDFSNPKSRVPQISGSEQAKRHSRQTWDTGDSSTKFNSLHIFTRTSVSMSSHLLPIHLFSPIINKKSCNKEHLNQQTKDTVCTNRRKLQELSSQKIGSMATNSTSKIDTFTRKLYYGDLLDQLVAW